jgi:hypothetical protein
MSTSSVRNNFSSHKPLASHARSEGRNALGSSCELPAIALPQISDFSSCDTLKDEQTDTQKPTGKFS